MQGEQFQRILYLDQISVDFSPTLWYLSHVLSVLNSVADLMPASRRNLAMVNTEVCACACACVCVCVGGGACVRVFVNECVRRAGERVGECLLQNPH